MLVTWELRGTRSPALSDTLASCGNGAPEPGIFCCESRLGAVKAPEMEDGQAIEVMNL